MLKKLLFVDGAGKMMMLLGGMFVTIVVIVNAYYLRDSEFHWIIVRSLLMVIIPALLLPAVVLVSVKVPLFGHWRNLIAHFFMGLLFVAIFIFTLQSLLIAWGGYNIFQQDTARIIKMLERQLLFSGSMAFLMYWGIAVLSGLQRYYKDLSDLKDRSNKLEAQLSQASLSTLKAQLKPHFLFNTLNMVDFLIHTDPEKAIDTVSKLEDLIKSTFDTNQPDSCTIKAEIRFLKKYLSIEKARFKDRLSVKIEIDEKTKEISIPCYLIQPLVENSIKHGVGKSMNKCTITIRSRIQEELLVIEVLDDGDGPKKKPERSNWSIGLRNIDERLKLYFGEGALLDVSIRKEGGFRSSILIPKKYILL